MTKTVFVAVLALASAVGGQGAEPVSSRKTVVLEGNAARLVIDLGGGALSDFRLAGSELNPLSWGTPKAGDGAAHAFGHFLCLDRWGPPSEAEGARGMPYHGEASNVEWALVQPPMEKNGARETRISARLPKAGLSVTRIVRLSQANAAFQVREEITNDRPLGRIFNVVQHPTIAPPFLDESTLVDCNGTKGFAQGGALPNPEEPSAEWPVAVTKAGERVNLRQLGSDPNPNVATFAIEEEYGWVTAASPAKGLLLGYVWKKSDYPWVSMWRDVREGKPAARGLEFGTTGMHQPFPILVKKGRLWDRPLFEYIDAGETMAKSYQGFLLTIPADFSGVASMEVKPDRLILRESKAQKAGREFMVSLNGLSEP